MTDKQVQELTQAIKWAFTSGSLMSGDYQTNIVDAIDDLATSTHKGSIRISESLQEMTCAIGEIADALESCANAIGSVVETLDKS